MERGRDPHLGIMIATLIFEVELVACRPRKGSSVASALDERARLESYLITSELKRQREWLLCRRKKRKRSVNCPYSSSEYMDCCSYSSSEYMGSKKTT